MEEVHDRYLFLVKNEIHSVVELVGVKCNLEKKAKECGLKRMALEVADNNYPAMALYLKCGFTCKDKRRTPCDFTHYECRLWLEKTLS